MSKQDYTSAVAHYFEARPNRWITAYELMEVGGQMGWRTRVSNARIQYRMTIENRVERDERGVATSYYRFIPDAKTYTDLLQIAEAR